MKRRTLAALLILVVAVLTTWYTRQTAPEREVLAPAHVPDYFLRHFTITRLDPDGEPQDRLSADYLVHFADDDTAELEQPEITLFQEDGPPWRIESATAHIDRPADQTWMRGNVIVQRSGPTIEDTEMVTDHLLLHPEANTAETDARVTITRPSSRMTGIGMKADLNRDEIALLSEVRGEHVSR